MVSASNSVRSASATARPPLPSDIPELSGAEVAAVYYGQRMGGDFYDFIRVSPNRVLIGLMDVAGRNLENRSILVAVQQTFRSRGAELLAKEEINEAEAMIRLCLELNRTVMQAAGGVSSCPAFAGCYREDLGTICYFNAGHTPGLLRDATSIMELPATGLPLGLFSHTMCDAPTVALLPSAALLITSRGIIEGKHKNEEFGLDRLKETFQQTASDTAKEICLNVLGQVQQFMRTPPTHNDITAVALLRARTLP